MNPSLRRLFLAGSGTVDGGGFVEASYGPGIILGDSTTARVPTVTSFLRNPAQNLITDLAVPGQKTNGEIAAFDALSSGVKAAARWIIVMTGLNDRTDFPDGPTEVANYQAAINHLRAVCPTAKILIAKMNPAFSFYDAVLNVEGAAAVAKYKAQWIALNDAIGGTGPTPITGADFRVTRQTGYLMDPSYPNSLNPLLAENPGDLHQNIIGSRIIAAAWQNGLDSVLGTAAPVIGNQHAYCAGKIDYTQGNYPFIDRMKTGAGFNFFSGCTKNAAGWLTNIPPGASASSLVCSSAIWFPPGNYVITSTSLGTIVVGGLGMTNIVNGVHRATFTVPDGNDDFFTSSFSLQPSIVNNTGAAISCMDFKIFLASNEALVNAGGDNAVFEPIYLSLIAGAKAIRFEEWMGINHTGYTPTGMWKFTDFGVQTLDKPSYINLEGQGGACVPAMMLLCRLIGARPWIPIGNAGNQGWFRYTHADNRFHSCAWYDYGQPGISRFANGVRVTLATSVNPTNATGVNLTTSLYVVNAVQGYDGTFQLSLTSGGTPVQVSTVDLALPEDFGFTTFCQVDLDEYTDMFRPLAECMFAIDPTCQPLVEYSNECWNFIYDQWGYLHNLIGRVVIGSGLQSAAYMYLSMKQFKAFEDVFPPSQVSRVVAWMTQPIDFAYQILSDGLDFPDTTGIYDNTKTFRQILLEAPSRNYFAVAPYIEPQRTDGSWHNAATIYAELGRVPTNADWDAYYDDSVDRWITGRPNYYTTWAQIRASLDTWLPGGKFIFYEWGQQNAWNQPALPLYKTIAQSASDYLESAAGAAMYGRAFSALIAPYNVEFVAFYDSEGSRNIAENSFSHWGITNRWLDNPAAAWWRTK